MDGAAAELESHLPGLAGTRYAITSDPSELYNCIAWVAGESHRWWSPLAEDGEYWPLEYQPEATIEVVQSGLATAGFERCPDGALAVGVEKIRAIRRRTRIHACSAAVAERALDEQARERLRH